ncbi:MAG: penicillin-binding protein 2 [Myxococcaceae bacterium]|nr:penicillin-binding protein 2 [Myxococcaceae bacterium]MBH2006507.1 penicillin-binding protein 2 [Myxococcaceae bacterium]
MVFSDRKFALLNIVPVIIFVLLGVRLFYLQLIRGDYYLDRSESNFIQERLIPHSRGLIMDQAGVILVDNRPSHDLYITFSLFPDVQSTVKRMAPWLHYKRADMRRAAEQIQAAKTEFTLKKLNSQSCQGLESWMQSNPISGAFLQDCDLVIDPLMFPNQAGALIELTQLLGISAEEMEVYWKAAAKKSSGLGQYKAILLVPDLDFEAYARLESAISLGTLPGLSLFDSIRRRYVNGPMAAHALGYVNEISASELQKKTDYRQGQKMGRKGIELVYESVLRGVDGFERVVVDAKGRRYSDALEQDWLGDDRVEPSIPGKSIVLSMDAELQAAAEKAFSGKAGSIVALEVGTGFVLAMASFPNYDPNRLLARNNRKAFQSLTLDPLKPWLNKSIQEHYAPGSTFKAITAVAGFEHELVGLRDRKYCNGLFHLGRASWRCYKREGHGSVDVIEALKTSCDAFFYNLAYELGSERLAQTARLLGFGRKTGVELDMEIPGIMPDQAYYKKRLGYYTSGQVVNSGIGQGDVAVTPLQLAVAYDAIVNGGTLYRPQLVREIQDVEGHRIEVKKPVPVAHLKDSVRNLGLVKEALSHVFEPGGTVHALRYRSDLPELAQWLKESGVVIGGKTGTAQVVRLSKAVKHLDPSKVAYWERDHAWFVGFAPADKPEIVVVAMTEHGGFGGSTSAPVVVEVIKTWFEKVRMKGRYAKQK